MSKKIIGISGVAGSGKDTFFELLSEEIDCRRYSLADCLKKEVNEWTEKIYNINAMTCTRLEKEIIRPFLVFHAGMRRTQTEGRYWIDKLDTEINEISPPKKDGVITRDISTELQVITDIRFDEYDKDEVYWLKEELNGYLIHISMYKSDDDPKKRIDKPPANDAEAKNDPLLREKADYCIEWPELSPFDPKDLKKYVNDFILFLNENNKIIK